MSSLPKIPAAMADFIPHWTKNLNRPVAEILEPYLTYEARLREIYAQEPNNPMIKDPHVNTVPLFIGKNRDASNDDSKAPLRILKRDLDEESELEKSKYIMPLEDRQRRAHGSAAVVPNFAEFQRNFSIFSEGSLSELNWSNVVCSGSAVLTSLVPAPKKYRKTKRGLRKWYHNISAPTSDVDLFLYGLTEEQALKKIIDIERAIKDAVLTEVTTVRTKNAITICTKYPTRHVQIVLRLYNSVSEILTGFDVDCSCVAYDGKQVWAAPRAVASLVTQINRIDITRRSPSYESRLAKYASRGFEIHWPELDRNKIDPTIFERSFIRTVGLARLLVLEKLPTELQRMQYSEMRREERGRPHKEIYRRHRKPNTNDVKGSHEVEVSDWVVYAEAEEVSNYHTFTIPYGEKYDAKKIERMLYTKDLLLNAEWNEREDREDISLHRHPAFIGDAEHIFEDCCGFCPSPETKEEEERHEKESKIYVSGKISFIKDNPGRQTIGSFNPITDIDWSEMAYVAENQRLFQAIVDCDLEVVSECLSGSEESRIDPNSRDHTGRTPLHLAVSLSSPEIVSVLIEHGANITPRLFDGQTAMHLAVTRGNEAIMKILDDKSKLNKDLAEKLEREQAKNTKDGELIDHSDAESESEASTSGESTVLVKAETCEDFMKSSLDEHPEVATLNRLEPKDDILNADSAAWDNACTPLHLAIVHDRLDALKFLIDVHGSDPSFPIKLFQSGTRDPSGAILSLVLALACHSLEGNDKTRLNQYVKVLIDAGAKANQADLAGRTAFEYFVNEGFVTLNVLTKYANVPRSVVNWIELNRSWGSNYTLTLLTAIENKDMVTLEHLLSNLGASPQIKFSDYVEAAKRLKFRKLLSDNTDQNRKTFEAEIEQPILAAVRAELPNAVKLLVEMGANVNTLTPTGGKMLHRGYNYGSDTGLTLLEEVRRKIKALREYQEKKSRVSVPEPMSLREDAFYLSTLDKESYTHFTAMYTLNDAKKQYERNLKKYKASLEPKVQSQGATIKLAKVRELEQEFLELEKYLVSAGAKVYEELYSLTEQQAQLRAAKVEPILNSTVGYLNPFKPFQRVPESEPEACEIPPLTFKLPDLTKDKTTKYTELFEAAWKGDLETIKKLATTSRKVEGRDEEDPPLLVAVSDSLNNNPFAIALFRGHWDTAMGILALAHAQWTPLGKKKLTYTMEPSSSDNNIDADDENEDSEDENEIELYSKLPASERNKFTIEDIGQASTLVQSKISAEQLLKWTIPDLLPMFGPFKGSISKHHYYGAEKSVFLYAIMKDDFEMFTKLIDVGLKYHKLAKDSKDQEDEDENGNEYNNNSFELPGILFKWCLSSGQVSFVEELMRRFGAGIPLDVLVENSGIVIEKKPKHYQGLSIRGAKNAEWANAYEHYYTSRNFNTTGESPPLLLAAKIGSLDSVKWLLTRNTVMKAYAEFAKNNADDERIKSLSELPGGFEKAVKDWLNTRNELALHCAIISKNLKTFKYLVETFPHLINTRSAVTGLTPLLLAFQTLQYDAAKILLEAGADPFVRDAEGNNIAHCLLKAFPSNCTDCGPGKSCGDEYNQQKSDEEEEMDYKTLKHFFELLPENQLREKLFIQRNSYEEGGDTPLGLWLGRLRHSDCKAMKYSKIPITEDKMDRNTHCCGITMLRTILEFSKGKDLFVVEASGNTPTHQLVSRPALLLEALRIQPACIFRENAVGRTTAELARENWLKTKIDEAPRLGDSAYKWIQGHRINHKGIFDCGLVARNEKTFEDDFELLDHQDAVTENIWNICHEHEAAFGKDFKRRLVTLNEANEVVKRLASQTLRRERLNENSDDASSNRDRKKTDEVASAMAEDISSTSAYQRYY